MAPTKTPNRRQPVAKLPLGAGQDEFLRQLVADIPRATTTAEEDQWKNIPAAEFRSILCLLHMPRAGTNLINPAIHEIGELMASSLPLEKMSVEEKLQAMESLWDDLCSQEGVVTSPAWHEDVLKERDTMRKGGDDALEDWETAKRNIRNKAP